MQKRRFIRNLMLGGSGCLLADGLSAPLIMESCIKGDKHLRKSMFFTETPGGARCLLCPNLCELKSGEEGLCHNRINIENTVYSNVYGYPCAVNIDPVEKKPLFHFYPGSEAFSIGTSGCTLACLNCQNWEISQTGPDKVKNYDLMPERLVKECIRNSCKSLAYTYNEPLSFYEYAYDSAVLAKSEGIKNILVSNGFIEKEPLKMISKYMDAANIDLKSFSDDIYLRLNAGRLQPILDALNILRDEGVWLEITNLIIPGWTDSMDMISKMCDWLLENGFENNPLHFSRFFPAYKLDNVAATPAETVIKARDIALKAGHKFVYIGNIGGTSMDNTWCPKCRKLIVERSGFKVLTMNVINGCCKYCHTKIAGTWD